MSISCESCSVFNFFMILSGICWTIVYVEVIRLGFKYKTYGMPLIALALNFTWEFLYGFGSYLNLIPKDEVQFDQQIINIVWCCFDLVILFTFFKYGREFFSKKLNKLQFIIWGILALVICFILQFLIFCKFPINQSGEGLSAFLQNIIMSVFFIQLILIRPNTQGQSMGIAIFKCLGTLAATMLSYFAYIQTTNYNCCIQHPSFLSSRITNSFTSGHLKMALAEQKQWVELFVYLGLICLLYDLLYIVMLWLKKKKEAAA